MNKEIITVYTFEIKGTVKVSLSGSDTDTLYWAAVESAIEKAKKEIEVEWIDNCKETVEYIEISRKYL